MKVTVIGAGKSGLEAAKLAKRKGYEVFLTESKIIEKTDCKIEDLEKLGINFEFGGNSEKAFDCDFMITSPGVPPQSYIIKEADNKKIKVISEIEFAFGYLKNKIIAITGTNGKTTTTSLIEFIFKNSGRKAIAAGNIGLPLSSLVDNIDDDTVIVLEVSSYQLDRCDKFAPDVAIIMNITPDHLSYHSTYENYIFAKFKISSSQTGKNLLILNRDDETIASTNYKTDANVAEISLSDVGWGIYVKNDRLVFKDKQQKEGELMYLGELSLPGVHNAYNSMAAALAARAFEIRNEDIRDSLMKFKGVEHRLEFVRNIDGVDFINDSKATNINATWFALSSYKTPIIWIAGGRGDNNDYTLLDDLVNKNVKEIIAIGEEADTIFNHFCTMKRVIKVNSLENAVQTAYELAESGDKVLFAPACKSFDMFMNFEHRGEVFKSIVNDL